MTNTWTESLLITKDQLTTVDENTTMQEIADLFKQPEIKKFRALPILDSKGLIFRGNIYKQHVMQHQLENGDMSLPVTSFMRNSTKFVHRQAKFYELFFALGDLPFISVIDENHHFHGIITHTALTDQLAQSWSIQSSSVALSVLINADRGNLATLAKIITKYTIIDAVITLHGADNQEKMVFTLPLSPSSPELGKIMNRLTKKGFVELGVEDLSQFKA